MKSRNPNFRKNLCFILTALVLLQFPGRVTANWGFEVGRAGPGDVAYLGADWRAFKKARAIINDALLQIAPIERQKQLLGATVDENSDIGEIAEAAQQYWLANVLGPLQRIALNPAASCAEAQFAGQAVQQMERQRQLIGLPEDQTMANVRRATLEMVSLRCREEALDECVATGRIKQIVELMMSTGRQAQLLGTSDDLESWAEDALKQCAIYELHFVSTTRAGHSPMAMETVRDGKVSIKLAIPSGGLKSAASRPLGEMLKGETSGGNNPFFVSVKCSPPIPTIEVVCSPGADSGPIKVRINALELKHKEFYIGHERPANPKWPWETVATEFTKERMTGDDSFSFDFEGGIFSLQGLVKAPFNTVSMPFPDWGNSFYIAHQKDQVGGPRSPIVKIERVAPELKRGVYPVMLELTYKDQNVVGGMTSSDKTEFELVHKPSPKPFPERSPDPIRRPLTPRPGQ